MKRKASIATAAVFLAVLFGFSLLHLALPDREVSRSERRRLDLQDYFIGLMNEQEGVK
mgnify:CR=1 FL=1